MSIEELRENLFDLADMIHPSLGMLKSEYITIEDMVDFVIYESIKKEYDDNAEKKSIRQHILDKRPSEKFKSEDNYVENEIRKLSRSMRYAQYYRDFQNERLIERSGYSSEELLGKDMDDIVSRMGGYEITDLNFYELSNMVNIPLMKKIVGKQIVSSKKVPNDKFIEYMKNYDAEINRLYDEITTPECVLYNTEAYFTCEWKFDVDIVYKIVIEAEKRGYPEFDPFQARFIFGEINIPPTTEWFSQVIMTECRMINMRDRLVPLSFETDSDAYGRFICICAEFYRLRDVLKRSGKKSIVDLVKNISITEKADFIKKHFWIWNKHIREKDWTPKRIQYARSVYKKMYLDKKEPSIK